MKVTLTCMTPNPLAAVEEAASQCYDSQPTADGRIAKHCYSSGHLSVFEHVSFTWHIEGVSRALLAQLTRHRIGAAFSVRSQRYCREDGFDYVTPKAFQTGTPENKPAMNEAFQQAMRAAQTSYDTLIALGAKPEDARMVLPNACCTTLQCTMNLRELMHFCNERLCACAQAEIREMCKAMADTVNKATDDAFAYALVPKCETNLSLQFCAEDKKRSCGRHMTAKEIGDLLKDLKR